MDTVLELDMLMDLGPDFVPAQPTAEDLAAERAFDAARQAHDIAAPGEDEEADLPVPEPRDGDFDVEKYPEPEPILDKYWCLYDEMGQSMTQVARWKSFQKIITYDRENRGKVHPYVFIRECKRLYDTLLRDNMCMSNDPRDARKRRGPPWSAFAIWNWPSWVQAPYAIQTDILRTFQVIIQRMNNSHLFRKKPKSGEQSVDLKAVDQFCKLTDKMKYWLEKADASRYLSLVGPLG